MDERYSVHTKISHFRRLSVFTSFYNNDSMWFLTIPSMVLIVSIINIFGTVGLIHLRNKVDTIGILLFFGMLNGSMVMISFIMTLAGRVASKSEQFLKQLHESTFYRATENSQENRINGKTLRITRKELKSLRPFGVHFEPLLIIRFIYLPIFFKALAEYNTAILLSFQ